MAGQAAAVDRANSHRISWWLLLPVALWLVWSAWPQAGSSDSAAQPDAESSAQSAPVDQRQRPLPSALLANELAPALTQARDQMDDDSWRALRRRVDDACVVPALLQLDGRREPDLRRDWAREALVQRCAGLPTPSLYRPGLEVRAERADVDPLPDPASALAQLRRAQGGQALVQAWLEAYLVDALPQDRIFSDGRRLLPADAEALIAVVQDWRDCAAARACGPDSLLTLKVCAQHGCRPGADLLEAWHEALSPRDWSAAWALHQWLLVEVPVDAG